MKFYSIKKYFLIVSFSCFALNITYAQIIQVTVDATKDKKKVSPYIYGRNNTFDQPAQFYLDAGLHFSRMNGGNNATKYNWRKKLTSHPDWYNNVYQTDWDQTAKDVSETYPDMQQLYAFQLIGRVASNDTSNFNDWNFNQSQYWFGVGQNLAGGGVPNTTDATHPSTALVEGNSNLYTQDWPADSTVGILNHWFSANGLGLNKNQLLYWNMDNEPDVWNGTHDDVMKTMISASAFMDNYIVIAKKARALFPEIKFCGPVTTSEWQWFKWSNESININGKYYCWLEYFIKRCADEEKASGVRVLDVVDLHNYPWAQNGDVDALQLHRMYYDTSYVYAGANGLFTINGGWDTQINKEYIFKRINDWLTQYFGPNSGITCSISEWSPASSDPNVASVVYASHLGTFANNGVEFFTPWTWNNGMWETLHLFSRYAKNSSVLSISSEENTVSAYTTVNDAADSMTVIIVNRDMQSSHSVTVNLYGFSAENGKSQILQLASLPSMETFVSQTNNALKKDSINVNSNSFTITVPALSTTAVLLKQVNIITAVNTVNTLPDSKSVEIYPNPVKDQLQVKFDFTIEGPMEMIVYNLQGQNLKALTVNSGRQLVSTIDVTAFPDGLYFLSVQNSHYKKDMPFIIAR
jgi:hypothetical protein